MEPTPSCRQHNFSVQDLPHGTASSERVYRCSSMRCAYMLVVTRLIGMLTLIQPDFVLKLGGECLLTEETAKLRTSPYIPYGELHPGSTFRRRNQFSRSAAHLPSTRGQVRKSPKLLACSLERLRRSSTTSISHHPRTQQHRLTCNHPLKHFIYLHFSQ